MKSVIQDKVRKRRPGRSKTSYIGNITNLMGGNVEEITWDSMELDGKDWCEVLHRRLIITPGADLPIITGGS